MARITDLGAITVHVTDFERARTFYQETFGLKELESDGANGWAAYQVPGGATLGLHVYEKGCEGHGRPPGTITGLVLYADDPQAFCDHVADHGGEITDPVEQAPWGSLTGTVADPDGNEYIIGEPPSQE